MKRKAKKKKDPLERVVLVMPRSLLRLVDAFAKEIAREEHHPNRSAAARILIHAALATKRETERRRDDLDELQGRRG